MTDVHTDTHTDSLVQDTHTGTDSGTHTDAHVPDIIFNLDTGTGTHDSGGTTHDSGSGGGDTGMTTGGTVPLFGACQQSSDCMSGGCLPGFPVSFCTQSCMTDSDCNGGACVTIQMGTSICFPGCTMAQPGMGSDTACDMYGGACTVVEQSGTTGCVPSCFVSGAPAGDMAMCPSGMQCDPNSGACTTMPTTTGMPNGSPCTMDSDCAGGRCLTATDPSTMAATGFVGGYCISFGRQPAATAYAAGQPIPPGNCPTGSAILPLGNEGDVSPCLKVCMTDSDCRASQGYSCQPLGDPTMGATTSNGLCQPIDCSMGGTCPSGTTCMTMTSSTGQMYGVCG